MLFPIAGALKKDKAIELGIRKDVMFLGFREDIPELMSLFDLLIVPSLHEPFGRVVIEAMACQTPVVASAVDGILEIFQDGFGGLFFRYVKSSSVCTRTLFCCSRGSIRLSFSFIGRLISVSMDSTSLSRSCSALFMCLIEFMV